MVTSNVLILNLKCLQCIIHIQHLIVLLRRKKKSTGPRNVWTRVPIFVQRKNRKMSAIFRKQSLSLHGRKEKLHPKAGCYRFRMVTFIFPSRYIVRKCNVQFKIKMSAVTLSHTVEVSPRYPFLENIDRLCLKNMYFYHRF